MFYNNCNNIRKDLYIVQNSVRVCVDKRDGTGFFGSIYHRCLKKPQQFCDINEMVIKIDSVFNMLKYPEAATEYRIFGKKKITQQENSKAEEAKRMAEHMEEKNVTGKKATFIVQIQYRQNSTWQGQVVWSEKNEKKKFRSALELIKLIDSATEESKI